MTIETATGERLAPEPDRPYWRDPDGERLSFQEVVSGLAPGTADEVAERHAQAVAAVARAATEACLRGDSAGARRQALAAARLCGEIVGFWPRDSWKPIR